MKKIITTTIAAAITFAVNAQTDDSRNNINQRDIFEVGASLVVIAIVIFTLLTVVKRYMDFRLKNKMLDKGISETVVASILQVNPDDNRNNSMKWFLILVGIGIALTVIYYTLPLGIQSLAIMAFSIAASFLAYYFFLRQSEK
jgi:glucose uptake protein GlcU